jgi:hypothetical protein
MFLLVSPRARENNMLWIRRSAAAISTLSFIATIFVTSSAEAIPFAVDTFQDGTTMGWFVPGASPLPPTNVANGGPAGDGDAYLQLRADASLAGPAGAGSRLSVLNESQWTGDFRDAGITAISMDVNNFGPDDLYLRLFFEDFDGPPPPANLALTVADVFVPANSGWMNVVFDLSAANLLAGAFGTVEGALTDVDVMRIFHNPDPAFPGPGVGVPVVTTTLGVDNITAIVPEPATGILLIGGLAAAVLRARHARRRS